MYKASKSITSDGIIQRAENVEFQVGEFILLSNNFSVNAEANFFIGIESCE